MKISVTVQNIKQAQDLVPYVDAYLLPVDNYSINYPNTFSIEDIKTIKQLGKEVFVIINKNIHNNELEGLRTLLLSVDKLNIEGIIFYDLAILNLKNKLNLNLNNLTAY